MTNAPWIHRGRALTVACLSLTLAAPLPAAIAASPAGPDLANVLERDAHRSKALAPARRELARKRAERARLEAGGKPAVKPPADRKDKAPADAAARAAAASQAAATPAPAPAKASPSKGSSSKPAPAKGGASPSKAAPVGDYGESTKLDLPTDVEAGPSKAATGGGGGIGRLLFSLLIVVGLIYGLTAGLRRMRNGTLGVGGGKASAGGLKAVASIPLGPNRSIHLVRAGQEYLLVGAAEHGVVPLRTYTEDEARAAGLLDLDAKRAGTATAAAATAAQESAPASTVRPWDGLNLATLVDDLRAKTVRR